MNNFRKFKDQSKPAKGIDGFVSSGKPAKHSNLTAAAASNPPRQRKIGDFTGPEGFQPATRGKIASNSQLGRQPKRDLSGRIELDLPESSPAKVARPKRSWLNVTAKAFAAIIVSGVLVGGYLFGKGYLKARQIFKGGTAGAAALQTNVDPTKLNGEGDGRINILLLGKGGTGHTAPDLTDTILVASIDPVHKEAALLSIPRDLWVKSGGSSSKINAVYANAKSKVLSGKRVDDQKKKAEEAGLKAIEEVVEDSMGIPVHYHAMIDFEGFKRAIDTVGGVDVNVKTPLRETMSIDGRRYVLDVKTGHQHFDGFKALAYARSRMVSARGDFDRAERQRLIMIGMKDKVFSVGTFSNPVKISQLISDFGNNMQSNLSTAEVMRLYEIGKDIKADKIASVGLADPPNNFVTTGNVGGLSVVIPRAGVGNFTEIKNYIRNALKDGFIRDENANIAVYNGTTIGGLAGRKATDLRSYGYTIDVVADAPTKNYPKTVLVDMRKGAKKYTKSYLEKRLKTTAVSSVPAGSGINPGNADFVIILGQNEAGNY